MILFKLGNICCESLLDYLILRMFIVFTLVVISYLLRRSPCNYLTLSRAILCDGEIYYDIVMCCVRGAHSSPAHSHSPPTRCCCTCLGATGRGQNIQQEIPTPTWTLTSSQQTERMGALSLIIVKLQISVQIIAITTNFPRPCQ